MRRLAAMTVLLLAWGAASAAEPVTLPNTQVRAITAKANGVAYRLYVSVPPGYAASSARYPVIYVLDADYSFAIARNVVEHMAERDHLPWAIVVGIAYAGEPQYRLHRTRDYTPTHTLALPPGVSHQQAWQKHSGGGPRFRDFVRNELLPLIEANYRTSRERVLVGHSYGGLFASWMLLTAPDVFTGYIAVSPSLWYDDRLIFALEKGAARNAEGRVYLAVGGMEAAMMDTGLQRLERQLRTRATLAVRRETLEGETHNSVFPGVFSRGIRFVLKGR